jgi:hypothetical protein
MWLRKEWVCFQLLFFTLCAMVPLTSSAQQNRESTDVTYSHTSKPIDQHAKPITSHVLTPDEGLAVLGAALESRAHPDLASDCSHLVHAIYERAGYSYSYANSSTLYAGSAEFRRVTRPQPGDLVVWPCVPDSASILTIPHIGGSADVHVSSVTSRRSRLRFRSLLQAKKQI